MSTVFVLFGSNLLLEHQTDNWTSDTDSNVRFWVESKRILVTKHTKMISARGHQIKPGCRLITLRYFLSTRGTHPVNLFWSITSCCFFFPQTNVNRVRQQKSHDVNSGQIPAVQQAVKSRCYNATWNETCKKKKRLSNGVSMTPQWFLFKIAILCNYNADKIVLY